VVKEYILKLQVVKHTHHHSHLS